MRVSHRANGFVRAMAIALSLAIPMMLAASIADARPGGGGSRGARTFSQPRPTATAPTAQPMQRSMTQPGTPAAGAAAGAAGAAVKKPGMMGGMLGGLAAGFLGAGLLGMLFGGGLFSGLGGIASILGLVAQIALVVIVVRLGMSWWQRRNAPSAASASASQYTAANAGPNPADQAMNSARSGGFGFGANTPAQAPLEIVPADYEVFERLLGDVQTAWSNEDVEKLHTLGTPEMVSYFTEDLKANVDRGVVNKVSDVKLLQGDLAESWREGETDYATVALRFGFVEKTTERASGRLVDGSDTPTEATEIWTFVRRPGSDWELSAIQNT